MNYQIIARLLWILIAITVIPIGLYVYLSAKLTTGSLLKELLSQNDNLIYHKTPQPVATETYNDLHTYARLIDISYCIDSYHQIESPFKCELCSPVSNNMSLICQWYFDDAVCGYISKTYSNLFENEYLDHSNKLKKIVVSLRGTRSLHDTVADIQVSMIDYKNRGLNIPICGTECRVHSGFWGYFKSTLEIIESRLQAEIEVSKPNYELIFVGHSLGGSVALLLALHFLDLGYSKMTLVTMGQPLVGNNAFATWADKILGSSNSAPLGRSPRQFIRVIHKGDVVATVPRNGRLFERYHNFENQVYINTSAEAVVPQPNQVVDCFSGDNPECIAGDFAAPFSPQDDFYRNHDTYFRRMGLCGFHI